MYFTGFSLLQIFFFIEDAPLLYILEDFLPQLDEFFVKQESNLDVKEIDHALYLDEIECRYYSESRSIDKVYT